MNIVIVGIGYVGFVLGICFFEMGINVICVDVDEKKIQKFQDGVMFIYELGLDELVECNVKVGWFYFIIDLIICLDEVEIIFSVVGILLDEDGSVDLKYVLEVVCIVGCNIIKYIVLVIKSIVFVGMVKKVCGVIQEEFDRWGVNIEFDVVFNFEFLKEGVVIKDFMVFDWVVVGVESVKVKKIMERFYCLFILNGYFILMMDVVFVEMIKYVVNVMFVICISFMNDIVNFCECVGVNVDNVCKGMGVDFCIGSCFFYVGCGYGGFCFLKDVKVLVYIGIQNGYYMQVIEVVEVVNEK